MNAITCPNCEGHGVEPTLAKAWSSRITRDIPLEPCRTCNGTGSINIEDDLDKDLAILSPDWCSW